MNHDVDKVSFMPNGIFVVRFKSARTKNIDLQQGHYLFDNKPLIVRPWSEDVELVKSDVKEVPVWVKLHNLPLKFWGNCIPRIAGLVGKYVRCDTATVAKTRLGFARVMAVMPFGLKIPEFVKFLDEEGHVITIKIEFEWKPILRKHCGGIGHETATCRKPKPKTKPSVGKMQWRPKTIPEKQPVNVDVVPKTIASVDENPSIIKVNVTRGETTQFTGLLE
ncbi:uncharacterized protein LOC141657451 [Silene latifolia]|uniref:uncharacterized protein LOC141657451 n=1 Tax=Silene latifolia TaxID=37657 RepID=UPI003D7819EA